MTFDGTGISIFDLKHEIMLANLNKMGNLIEVRCSTYYL